MSFDNSRSSHVQLSDGRNLSYRLSGPNVPESDRLPMVLLSNSLAAPYGTWDHYIRILHTHNFRTLQYDQIGHGDSTVNISQLDSTTFEALADDVLQLLDSLKIQKLHGWVGISMGAATGVYFCTRNPGRVERLAVCDTISCSPNTVGSPDPFEARVTAARKHGNMDRTVEGTLARWFSEGWRENNDAEVQRMRGIMRQTKVDGFVACCRALQNKEFDLRPKAAKLAGSVEKVLLVVGSQDADLPETMAQLKDQIQSGFNDKNGELVNWAVVKDAGHVCVVDGLVEFSEAVTTFLTVQEDDLYRMSE